MFGFCLALSLGLSGAILMVGLLLSSSLDLEKEKGGAYECGFESFVMARVPFSLQFFLIGVIFLIFDVEIVLMMPVPLTFNFNFYLFFLFLLFVFILLFGLYFEWKEGALEWVKWMGI